MQLQFASRMNGLKASEIREILKVTQRPEVISLAGGLPAAELFPIREVQRICNELLENEGSAVLQYATTEGDLSLRNHIAKRMQLQFSATFPPNDILVTNGSQQGLDLAGKIMLDEGDVVLCESPTYLGAIQAFSVFKPRFVQVATDDDGMLPDDLERKLATTDRVKLIYVIPDFQNPSGRCWSADRRAQFMRVVRGYPVVVIEDCPYRELRFEGTSLPTLASMDEAGQVVVLGTFSKILCPGLRVAWVAAHRSIIEKFVLVKQGADLHSPLLNQRIAALFLETCDLDAHVQTIRKLYGQRRNAMVAAIDATMADCVSITRPAGGLFLWMQLPAGIDSRDLLLKCLEHNVAFVPGSAFFPNADCTNALRLNYSNMPEARIGLGIQRLDRALRDLLQSRQPTAHVA